MEELYDDFLGPKSLDFENSPHPHQRVIWEWLNRNHYRADALPFFLQIFLVLFLYI